MQFYNNPNYGYPQYQYQAQQQPQVGNIVQVSSPQEVETWPIAPGNSLTFYIASTPPMIATKTRSYNQLEAPVTKYYDIMEHAQKPADDKKQVEASYATKEDIESLWEAIGAINRHFEKTEGKAKNE